MPRPSFESASGLRPASAFVLVAFVLVAASGKVASLVFGQSSDDGVSVHSAHAVLEDEAPWPSFEIVDSSARPLALSVECSTLSLSPRDMWFSHTPRYMADLIAEFLPERDADELLARMLPEQAEGEESGVFYVEDYWKNLVREPALRFDAECKQRVERWLATGAPDDDTNVTGKVEGFWLVPTAQAGIWSLAWCPEVALTEDHRKKHTPNSFRRPPVWSRKIVRDLAVCLTQEDLPRAARTDADEALRRHIWAELLPSRYRVVRRLVEPEIAWRLAALLKDEGVSDSQMKLELRLDRRHPVRPLDPEADPLADAFSVLGQWGVSEENDAWRVARREASKRPEDFAPKDGDLDPIATLAKALMTNHRPVSGIERLAGTELRHPFWRDRLELAGRRTYKRGARYVARDRRRQWAHDVPSYFLSATDASEIPRVITTLDAELQSFVHDELLAVMEEHDPALAMAIAIDVETGGVLALDGVYAYETSGFAPLIHEFTPGSTMKPIVMALALDEGVVSPDTRFPINNGGGFKLPGSQRVIHEAIGVPRQEYLSAELGLVFSVNAVFVQIGQRIPERTFHDRLQSLGYGTRPGARLGPEAPGYLKGRAQRPWSFNQTHASVSFGHEIEVTLWQHATVLASIARGGLKRPLRLIEAIEQNGARWDLALEPGTQVLPSTVCDTVRGMLGRAAQEGTGRSMASTVHCPEFAFIGTKTGTTEKVPGEICLHVELPHNAEAHGEGEPCLKACRKQLKGQLAHKSRRGACYTCSTCAFGYLPNGEREVLVFVVVEDPRGKEKFGSKVAGPAAVSILRRSLGLTPRLKIASEDEKLVPATHTFNARELPWAEGGE